MEEQQTPGAWARVKRAFPTLWKPFVIQFAILALLNLLLSCAALLSSAVMLDFYRRINFEMPLLTMGVVPFFPIFLALAFLVSLIAFIMAVVSTPSPRLMSRGFIVLVFAELAAIPVYLFALIEPVFRCDFDLLH